MPITRRALLISNPGEKGAENYARGVYVDIRNYERLLTSAVGGAWNPDEIKHLDRPSVQEVRDWLRTFSTHEYVFVMFTGHGWYSSAERDRILELRKGEEMKSLDLLAGAKKRAVILDSCQKVHHARVVEAVERAVQFSYAAERRVPDRARCRQKFLNDIEATTGTTVRLMSCSIDEVSTDSDTEGGYYNSSVLACADEWSSAQAKQPIAVGSASFSIVAAHDCAVPRTRTRSGGEQNPTIEKAKTGPYFPFVVFA